MTTTPTDANPEQLRGVLLAGTRLRNYEIVSILGQGGFGVTYRARDTTLGRDVAIKEYLPTALALREDGTMVLPRSTELAEEFAWGRDRFVEEARTLAKFENAPSIVRVFDFLEAHGTAYMVMALLEGETLAERLKREGRLESPAVEQLLRPLLNGLEVVHASGFLHRDIKPDNILLDAAGNPTLIDFGASRAAMAGRTTAMTAIFTPGYAAAEQMTSAKQGPWTDIYGIAATMYHAITGHAPVSSFDRMLDDEYVPLGQIRPAGFSPGLLVGIDAGLAVRASERPQSIAGWRAILGQTSAPDASATIALAQQIETTTVMMPRPAPAPVKRRPLWIGAAAAAVLTLAGGGYYVATVKPPTASQIAAVPPPSTSSADRASQPAAAAEHSRQQEQAELARQQRADVVAREKAEAEAALRRQVEEETRRRIEIELVEKQRLEDEAKQAAEANVAAMYEAAKDGEAALHLSVIDRQHLQVALTALGFNTNGANGVFDRRSRATISAWQKAQNDPATGYLTAVESQALLKAAAPAVARFVDDQKKIEEEKQKAAAGARFVDDQKKIEEAKKKAPSPSLGSFDGAYAATFATQNGTNRSITVKVVNGSGVGTVVNPSCGSGPISLTISTAGAVSGAGDVFGNTCAKVRIAIRGQAENGRLNLSLEAANGSNRTSLARQGN